MEIILAETKRMVYFELFPLLASLEPLRPGIKDRVWKQLVDDGKLDVLFAPINGRILNINLFYYGIGDEYVYDYIGVDVYPPDFDHSKKVFPNSFIDGSHKKDMRLDFNLIISKYCSEINDIEAFPVLIQW